jgi:hypothetical protein
MAKMRAAIRAMHFGACAPKAFVHLGANGFFVQRIKKRRPACAAVVFGVGGKEGLAATDAGVGAALLVVGVFASEGSLGGFVSCHVEGEGLSAFGFELFAPLIVGFLDFVSGHDGEGLEERNTESTEIPQNAQKKTRRGSCIFSVHSAYFLCFLRYGILVFVNSKKNKKSRS